MSHIDPSVEELLDEDNFDAEIEAEKAEALRDARREEGVCEKCGCSGLSSDGDQLHWKECPNFVDVPCWHHPDDPSCNCN